jgi:hypothetical protein
VVDLTRERRGAAPSRQAAETTATLRFLSGYQTKLEGHIRPVNQLLDETVTGRRMFNGCAFPGRSSRIISDHGVAKSAYSSWCSALCHGPGLCQRS